MQEQRPNDKMLEKTMLFVTLSIGILLLHSYLTPKPPAPKDKPAPPGAEQRIDPGAEEEEAPKPTVAEDPESGADPADPAAEEEPVEEVLPADRFVTIGSVDPASPYRMGVTLTNRGAAVLRTELSSPRYRDVENRSGYLGYLVVDTTVRGAGCPVQVVVKGTPADLAGLLPGDLITSLAGIKVSGFKSLTEALQTTKPGDMVPVEYVDSEGQPQSVNIKLKRRPLEVMRPEESDQLSFLMSLHQIDDATLEELDPDVYDDIRGDKTQKTIPRDTAVDEELDDAALREVNWEVASVGEDAVTFRRLLPKRRLELTKTYRLAKTSGEGTGDVDYPAYHLELDVSVRNVGETACQVAYQLDGPTGLPIEGAWYARKVGPGWRAYGLRDVLISLNGKTPDFVRCTTVASDDLGTLTQSEENRLTYIGVDAQYFSAILIPQRKPDEPAWFSRSHAIRVGDVRKKLEMMTNTSCRLVSVPTTLEPDEAITHGYDVFVGPKRPSLLEEYGLRDSISYGWFWWVAIPMTAILHFFNNHLVFNYGLAIILLTVVVRSGMFPLSRKQALGARKMQELQPEIKKISEKYKKDPEALRAAQQELFRRHNYNPLSGCLPVFFQLPIFIGLYRALMVDVELRGASLLGPSVHWCSNLAAPDMLVDWSSLWNGIGWDWFNTGQGIFGLGPYFNILPLVTIVLFIVQQKMFMPPPTDDQAKMQQNMMTFMMVFMGFIFFKVASGLCLYFIASSLWGVAERKLLPKHEPKDGAATPAPAPLPPPRRRPRPQQQGQGKKKKRRKR